MGTANKIPAVRLGLALVRGDQLPGMSRTGRPCHSTLESASLICPVGTMIRAEDVISRAEWR